MTQKPTYEELEQKVKELENKALERERLEEEVERIFNLSLDMIGSGNLDGYFTKINSSFGSMLGYTEKEFLEKPFISFVHDEDIEKTKEALAEAVKGKQNIYIENRYKCKDGSYKWIEWKVLSIMQKNKFITVGRDITARKQSDTALRDSQHMLHTVLDSIPTAVFWKDRDSFYLGGNRTWLAAVGLNSSEEVVGKSDYELPWYKEQANSFREDDRRVMESGLPEYNIIESYRKADGTQAWAKTNKVPLRDIEGNIVGVLGTYEDITERKQAEEALRESEEKYRSMMESMKASVYICSPDFRVEYMNPAMIKRTGIDVTGEVCHKAIHDLDERCSWCVHDKIQQGESAETATLSPKDNRHYNVSHSPIFHQDGSISKMTIYRDMTESKKAEEERIRLATAIEQASESIIISDRPGTIHYVNPAFEQLSGFNREEIIGQNFRILKSDKHDESFYREMYDIISHGHTWAGRIINTMKDGTLREFETRISPVKDSSGEIINFVSVNRDVTQEKALEAQLQHAQRMDAIGTLAGGIAHDFNNILSSVIGFTELALDDAEKGTLQYENLQEVLTAGSRAKDLVLQILTFSRQSDQEQKPVNVQLIAKEALKMLRASIPSTIEIKQNIQSEALVMGDSTQIHQVLMNLCTNAAHAMDDKGGVLTVDLVDIKLDSEFISDYPELKPGTYIKSSFAPLNGRETANRLV